jgi:hypothetical protein
MLNKTRDFAQITRWVSEVNHKMHLTKSTTQTKMKVGCGNPFSKGDNTPQSLAVFLCLSFLADAYITRIRSIQIMTALFWRPLWSVVPLHGITTRFNAVTNTVVSISDGYSILSKGITA